MTWDGAGRHAGNRLEKKLKITYPTSDVEDGNWIVRTHWPNPIHQLCICNPPDPIQEVPCPGYACLSLSTAGSTTTLLVPSENKLFPEDGVLAVGKGKGTRPQSQILYTELSTKGNCVPGESPHRFTQITHMYTEHANAYRIHTHTHTHTRVRLTRSRHMYAEHMHA